MKVRKIALVGFRQTENGRSRRSKRQIAFVWCFLYVAKPLVLLRYHRVLSALQQWLHGLDTNCEFGRL